MDFLHKNGYDDLVLKEKSRKINRLIVDLIKMRDYGIKDKELEKKYNQELAKTNKEVKWKDSSRRVKLYKVFGKAYIRAYAVGSRIKHRIVG